LRNTRSLKQICEKLAPDYKDELDQYRYNGAMGQGVLSYDRFEKILTTDGWILSDKTVRQKWKILKNSGIITEIPGGRAFVNIDHLAAALGYPSPGREKKIKIFLEQSAEEVRP
jgi:hypothetical protein